MKILIRLRQKRGGWSYVKGVSWGDGNRAKKLALTADKSEAFGFSLATAETIAKQYWNRDVQIVREDGTVSDSQTEVVRANEETRERVAKDRAEINEFFAEANRIIFGRK